MTTLLLEHLKDLQTNLTTTSLNHPEIIEKCIAILPIIESTLTTKEETKSLEEEIYIKIHTIKFKCNFILKQYDEVISSIKTLKKKFKHLQFDVEEAYAYYKSKNFDVCKDICVSTLYRDGVLRITKEKIIESIITKEEYLNTNHHIILHLLG